MQTLLVKYILIPFLILSVLERTGIAFASILISSSEGLDKIEYIFDQTEDADNKAEDFKKASAKEFIGTELLSCVAGGYTYLKTFIYPCNNPSYYSRFSPSVPTPPPDFEG